MSYTVVHDQQNEDLRWANLVNEVNRHCKIGKVTRKIRPQRQLTLQQSLDEYQKAIRWPFMQSDIFSRPIGNRKCSCLPGQACGNAACPHMPIVTCGTAMRTLGSPFEAIWDANAESLYAT